MDVREKLVELLDEIQHQGNSTVVGVNYVFNSAIANHLIANGVTVQECGHWKIIMDDYDCEMMQCSVCKSEFYDGENDTVDCLHSYCPHCGAKMTPQPLEGE